MFNIINIKSRILFAVKFIVKFVIDFVDKLKLTSIKTFGILQHKHPLPLVL